MINVAFIMITSFVVVRMLKLATRQVVEKGRVRMRQWLVLVIAILVAVPSLFSAGVMVRDEVNQNHFQDFIKNEMPNYYILDQSVDSKERLLKITVFGAENEKTDQKVLQGKLKDYHLSGFDLVIKQADAHNRELLEKVQKALQADTKTATKQMTAGQTDSDDSPQGQLKNLKTTLQKRYGTALKVAITTTVTTNDREKNVFAVTLSPTLEQKSVKKIRQEVTDQLKTIDQPVDLIFTQTK